MNCINKCGSTYTKELHNDYQNRLSYFLKEFEKY